MAVEVPFPPGKHSINSLAPLPIVKDTASPIVLSTAPQHKDSHKPCLLRPRHPTTMICCLEPRQKVLNADETVKRRLLLDEKSASDFALTSSEPGQHQYGDETPSDAAANNGGADFAWMSGSAGIPSSCSNTQGSDGGITGADSAGWGPSGPHGTGALQKMLDAMTTVGIAEGERDGLLRGLAAILHLGQVSILGYS